MKMTSEVIKELQALVAQHGDLPFVRYQQSNGGTCDDYGHDPDVAVAVERFEPTSSALLERVNGQWKRRPVPGIAEDSPGIRTHRQLTPSPRRGLFAVVNY